MPEQHPIHGLMQTAMQSLKEMIDVNTFYKKINNSNFEKIKLQIKNELKEFNINHSTIEFETVDYHCDNKNCHVEASVEVHHHH